MNALSNTIQILKPIIPQTDMSDAGYVKYYPGGAARPCLETLKNGSRLLDDKFWKWQYMNNKGERPNYTWKN